MVLDNFAVRVAILFEIAIVRFILLLPDSVISFLPYSRGTLEKQLVGDYYLMNRGMSVPEEAKRHYVKQGKFMIAVFSLVLVQKLVQIGIILVK